MMKKIVLFFMLLTAFFFLTATPNNVSKELEELEIIDVPEVEAANHTGGCMYFDNSKTNWNFTYICLFIGKDSWTSVIQMKQVQGTSLYYCDIPKWDGATYCAVAGGNDLWNDGGFGYNGISLTKTSKINTSSYTFNYGSIYLITASSGGSNAKVTWYSAINDLTITTKSYVCFDGDNYIESANGGLTNITARYMSSHGVSGSSTAKGTGITNSYNDIYRYSNATLEATVKEGYEFAGWYDVDGKQVSSDLKIDVLLENDSVTYHARWYKKISVAEGSKLYFVTNKAWQDANPRYTVHFFNPTGANTWVDMEKMTGGYYSVTVPKGSWSNIIICRMNPAAGNDWGARWTQTGNLTIEGTNNCFTLDASATTDSTVHSTGSWSTATPDTKTIYFATNQKWENAYVNVKLNNNTNELWYNTQMTATGDIYRNDIDVKAGYNKIYSITIPTLYSGVEEMQFDFDISDGFTGSHPAVASWMNSSEYDGKLYYYGVNNGTIDDSSLTEWKSNNTKVNFYAADKTTQLGSSVTGRWMHDKIDAPADLVPNDYVNWTALYGWYRKSNFTLSDKCYNYKKVEVYHEDGKNYGSYYAAIANTKRFYFATNNANLAETIYANTNVSKTGDIWLNLQMKALNNAEISNYDSSAQSNYYNGYKMYYVDMPLPEEGISELEFHNGNWQNKHTVVISENWITKSNLNEDLYYLEVDASGKATANTGWKNKITTTFYVNYAGGKDVLIIAHEGNKITPPELDNPDDSFVFAGWYDNAELMNSSVTTFVVSSTKNGYWASWCIPFQRNYDIHLILNSDSPWITKMGSEGNVVMFLYGVSPEHYQLPIKVTLNSDGSRVYTFRLPNDRDYSNCIFLCSDNGSIGTDVWEHRIYQTHDLKRTADDSGRIYYGYEITDLYEDKEYNGNWVHMTGGVTFYDYNGTDNFHVFHKEGYTLEFSIIAPENKYFLHWRNSSGNNVTLTFPYTLHGEKTEFTAIWGDTANFIDSDFFVKYKESSKKENSYGVVPFYSGIRFMAADSLVEFKDIEAVSYRTTITINGTVRIIETNTYQELVSIIESLCTDYECYIPIVDGYADKTSPNWEKLNVTFALKLEAIGKNSGNIYFNCTEDKINVNGEYKPISISNYVDKYIAEQAFSLIFDLENDYEDKALYQLHIHSFETSTNVNDKYINDALYIYKHCKVCDMKERINGVLMQYTTEDGKYVYKATQNTSSITEINDYVGTYSQKINYIYESSDIKHSDDSRNIAYAVFDSTGSLVNEFKSLYDAIEACYDFDMQCLKNDIDPYDDEGMGSYVCKVTNKGYDEVKMFVNKETYILEAGKENSDMFWYYQNGTSLQKYGAWDDTYWTDLMNGSHYISVERAAETSKKPSQIKGYASSYEVFAVNDKYSNITKPSTITNVYEHCFGLESAININMLHGIGITGARMHLALKDSRIYPSYADSDNAWIYVGYIIYDSLQVLHVGLKCDTRTGNWYRYVGEVTQDESGVEIIKEITGADGLKDVCYMTSTWVPEVKDSNGKVIEEGYFIPNENVSIGLNIGATTYSNGVRTREHVIKFSFDDNNDAKFDETDENSGYDRDFVEKVVSSIKLTEAQINDKYDYKNEVCSIRFTIGMDIETNDDLADFMCGAKFENVVINYSHAYIEKETVNYNTTYSKGKKLNVHNLYDKTTGKFVLNNECNYNSTIYNTLVASYSFDDKYKDGSYNLPVYNFSFRTIDSTNPALSTVITDVTNQINQIEAIETIVENDYYDTSGKEVSYDEYFDLVYNAKSAFNALTTNSNGTFTGEKTALELTYRYNNSYNFSNCC